MMEKKENFKIEAVILEPTVPKAKALTMEDVWGKHVLLIYVPDSPQLDELSCGYIFRVNSAAHTPWGVRTWREEAEKKEVIENEVCQDEKLTSNVAGYFLEDVIA